MKTVLIADDEANLRLLVSATIESDQYEVIEAGDGEEAWIMIRGRHPDVAILDVQMPGKSGIEITREIRSTPELASTKVILLTSKAQQADIEAGLAAGADQYLTKPFSPIELLNVLEKALEAA